MCKFLICTLDVNKHSKIEKRNTTLKNAVVTLNNIQIYAWKNENMKSRQVQVINDNVLFLYLTFSPPPPYFFFLIKKETHEWNKWKICGHLGGFSAINCCVAERKTITWRRNIKISFKERNSLDYMSICVRGRLGFPLLTDHSCFSILFPPPPTNYSLDMPRDLN